MNMRVLRRILALAAALGALAAPLGARAHPVTSRTENNRYIKLTLIGDTLRVAYSVLYGELPSFEERREMDRDHDGQVSEAEARARADEVAATLARGAVLEVDGRRVALRFPEREVGMTDRRVAPSAFSIDLWELVPLAPRPRHDVTFETHGDLRRMGESEVRFEESPGTRLTGYCLGHGPCPPPSGEARFVFMGPRRSSLEDRSVTASFATVGAAGDARRWALWGAGALAAVLIVVVGVMVQRRRRAA
jgi:hypothetical protein